MLLEDNANKKNTHTETAKKRKKYSHKKNTVKIKKIKIKQISKLISFSIRHSITISEKKLAQPHGPCGGHEHSCHCRRLNRGVCSVVLIAPLRWA
jgi:hypothetical protein